LEYAGIDKDVVLFAYKDFIEVWSKDAYNASLDEEPENFGIVTQGIFGNNINFPL
jgi:MraZ protein